MNARELGLIIVQVMACCFFLASAIALLIVLFAVPEGM